MKEAAKAGPTDPGGGPHETAEEPGAFQYGPGMIGPGRVRVGFGFPMAAFVRQLKDVCDFTALPNFDSVKKHFGASIGYVVPTEGGVYAEIVSLKAPRP